MLQKAIRGGMQSKSILSIVICVACILTLSGMALAQTATAPLAGDGSEGSPYQIATLENLYWIAADSAKWDKHYIQTADIDASATSEWNGGEGWTPIGTDDNNTFTGTYDGGGYIIDGLFINRATGSQGLFGTMGSGSQIKNLGVANVNITSSVYTGGLVGYNASGIVQNCYAFGVVSGDSIVGGLVGINASGTVTNCYACVTVSLSLNFDAPVGGLVGINYLGTVSNCYAFGVVSGGSWVGGLVGAADPDSTVSNSFYDAETTNQSDTGKGEPKTTEQMQTISTFTDAGWDFVDIWNIDEGFNQGYPYLRWQVFTPECLSDEDCNDGFFCTGVETCVDRNCVAGTIPCMFCNEEVDQCFECFGFEDNECPVGKECSDGFCVALTCNENWQCPQGFGCADDVCVQEAPPALGNGPFLAAGPWPVLATSESRAFTLDQNYDVLWTFDDDYSTCDGLTTNRARYRRLDGTQWFELQAETDATGKWYAFTELPVNNMQDGTYIFRTEIVDCAGQITTSRYYYFKVAH